MTSEQSSPQRADDYRLVRGAVVGIVAIAAANVVVFALNWIGPVLPDGPAAVIVTGLGSIGSLSAAGVALWVARQARQDARAAEAREEVARVRSEEREVAYRREGRDREDALIRRAEEREDQAHHLTVRPVLSLIFHWGITEDDTAVAMCELTNIGNSAVLDLHARLSLTFIPPPRDWPPLKPSGILAALAPGGETTYGDTFPEIIDGYPFGYGWHFLYFDLRYQDVLGWWWQHYVPIKPGGQFGLERRSKHSISLGPPVQTPPPSWVDPPPDPP